MIEYKLQKPQENFIKKKLLPMLESSDEDMLKWEGETYHIESVTTLLNNIIDSKTYNNRESKLLEDLRIVYQKTKR